MKLKMKSYFDLPVQDGFNNICHLSAMRKCGFSKKLILFEKYFRLLPKAYK